MTSGCRIIVVGCLLFAFGGEAVAYVYPGSRNCPWANETHTWAKYLNKEYGDKQPVFSIRFTRSIGDIEKGQCYTMHYLGGEKWSASGKIRNKKPHTSKPETRRRGDPLKNQLNVWGASFTFNEAGEIFYSKDGLLAGNMYCHYGSECWK